ncbi:hypothetical protein STENM327S_06500 [Streptomyces tendae]
MSESTMQSATELASQYSVQVTDNLERNVKEQERVGAEISRLSSSNWPRSSTTTPCW